MNPDLVGLSWEPRCGWQEAAAGGVGARKLILSIIQLHTSLSGNKAAHYLPTQTISEHRGHQHQHGSAPTRGGIHNIQLFLCSAIPKSSAQNAQRCSNGVQKSTTKTSRNRARDQTRHCAAATYFFRGQTSLSLIKLSKAGILSSKSSLA